MSGSEDKSLRLWEITTGECLRKLDGHMDTITSIIWKVIRMQLLHEKRKDRFLLISANFPLIMI